MEAFGDPKLESFEHWLHGVYEDPLEAMGPVRGKQGKEDQDWTMLKEPLFTPDAGHEVHR